MTVPAAPASPLFVSFTAALSGPWRITSVTPVRGASLPPAPALHIDETSSPAQAPPREAIWSLRGVTSNLRYTTRDEAATLRRRQSPLGRPEATCAALLPIRKSPAWWALAQDERRAILEEQSHHIAIGLDYLPAIARRLHHCRELAEPFDFLTYFDFEPRHQADFNQMLQRLRQTSEWTYVEREVDIRLTRA